MVSAADPVLITGLVVVAAPVISVYTGRLYAAFLRKTTCSRGRDCRSASVRDMKAAVIWTCIFAVTAGIGLLNMQSVRKQKSFADMLDGEVSAELDVSVYNIRSGSCGYQVYVYGHRVQTAGACYEGRTRLILYMDDADGIMIGQRLTLAADIKRPDAASNPGAYDAGSSYEAKGIYMTGRNISVYSAGEDFSRVGQWLYRLRLRAGENLETALGEADASVAKAMLLGDKTGLDADTKKLFQMNGIAHILAISGIHVAIIGMTLFSLLRKLFGMYLPAGIFSVAAVVLYGVMTGMAASTSRAVIMLAVALCGQIAGRSSDMLTAAGTAAVIQALANPYIVMDVGFQLSFGAVAGMAVYGSLIDKIVKTVAAVCGLRFDSENENVLSEKKRSALRQRLKRRQVNFVKNFIESLEINIAVTLATTPITIYYFYQFPLYAVLLNLVIVPLVSVVIFFSVCVMAAGMWSAALSAIAAAPIEFILDFYRFMCRIFLKLPCSNVNVGHISAAMMAVFYVAVFSVLWLAGRAAGYALERKKQSDRAWSRLRRISEEGERQPVCGVMTAAVSHVRVRELLCICAVVPIAAGCAAYEAISLDEGFVTVFMDVGQGDGIFVRTDSGASILIDGGSSDESGVGEYVIVPVLKYYGCAEVDYAFVSHGDTDHISGIKYILETENTGVSIRNLVLPQYGDRESLSELAELAADAGVNVMYLGAGDYVSDDEDFRMTCLYPGKDTGVSDENELSAVIMLTSGELDILFTGDVGSEGEAVLLSETGKVAAATGNTVAVGDDSAAFSRGALKADILKVGHHGSRYSSSAEFLEAVSPTYAVISAGRDNMYGHPHEETLERLEAAGADIMCTAETGAVIVTQSQNGDFSIAAYAADE